MIDTQWLQQTERRIFSKIRSGCTARFAEIEEKGKMTQSGRLMWTGTLSTVFLSGCTRRPFGMGGGDWGHMMNDGLGGTFMWLLLVTLVAAIVYILLQDPNPIRPTTS